MHPACSASFFFNDTATTEIYTLSLHDALPISPIVQNVMSSSRSARSLAAARKSSSAMPQTRATCSGIAEEDFLARSEEHTSELQSRQYLVCRLLLEKKNVRTNSTLPLCTNAVT